ncbi:hypothetical protein V5F41_12255 [Xanthobacter autotrophicus]|uniref:hypothetical protein n=1 Tax=Xanthobacter autotrophicus TaxID=280 RepID=UPI0037274837
MFRIFRARDPFETRVGLPFGFSWDSATYPIRVYKDGPRHFTTDLDPRSVIPSDVWNGPVFYAAYNGNNANAGTSPGTAVRSLWKMKQLLEASPAPGGIFMAMADPDLGYTLWDRNNDLNDTGGSGGSQNTAPTKPYALMSCGGVSYMGAVPNLTWTYDAASKTYNATRSLVTAVADFSAYNRWGIFERLPKLAVGSADLAATRLLVGAAPGSYALTTANDLVVRLSNDAVVSDKTVRVMLGTVDALKLGTVSCYISGFTLVGGTQVGVVNGAQSATRNVVMDDCEADFAGIDGGNGGRNNFAFDNLTGLVVLRRCKSASSHADNYNWHMQSGAMYGLMIDCEGIDAGRAGASPVNTSNQFVTAHEKAKLISFNSRGLLASGGLVRNINESEHWDLGSEYVFDRGDTRYAGGTQVSTGVVMNDTAKYWGDCITVRGCQQTFYATSAAEIRLRDPIEIGGVRGGSGLITKY